MDDDKLIITPDDEKNSDKENFIIEEDSGPGTPKKQQQNSSESSESDENYEIKGNNDALYNIYANETKLKEFPDSHTEDSGSDDGSGSDSKKHESSRDPRGSRDSRDSRDKRHSDSSSESDRYRSRQKKNIKINREKDSEDSEKAHVLYLIDRYHQKHPHVNRVPINASASLSKIKAEYERIKKIIELEKAAEIGKKGLIIVSSVLELGAMKYASKYIDLDGWSASVASEADEYDEILEELYLKYRENIDNFGPELKLVFALAFSAYMFNASKGLKKGFGMPSQPPPQMRGPPKLDISDDDEPVPPINPFPKPFVKPKPKFKVKELNFNQK